MNKKLSIYKQNYAFRGQSYFLHILFSDCSISRRVFRVNAK